ncbi:MAG: caspase family protein [Planctomycetota bacterium]
MRTMAIFSILLVCLCACLIAQDDNRGIGGVTTKEGASVTRGDFYLLVIGINDYMHFPKLQTAVNDAKGVRDTLIQRYGFEETKTVALFDMEATAKRIYIELSQLADRIGPDDSLVLFYAGHGQLDKYTKSGYWVPVNGAADDRTTWIPNTELLKFFKADAIKARHILLVSDSCFAGDFFNRSAAMPRIDDAYVRQAFQKTSREAITSGGVEPVTDVGYGGHSVFAHFFLKALTDNSDSYLMPTAIYERVKGGISQNASQQAQHGLLANTGGEQGGRVCILPQGRRGEPG